MINTRGMMMAMLLLLPPNVSLGPSFEGVVGLSGLVVVTVDPA